MASIAWVFRISNPDNDEVPKTWPYTKYVAWQKERGDGGLIHLQGYVVFNSRRALAGLKKIHSGAHWEVRRGTHAQAKAYATKEDTRIAGPWEIGEEPAGQGARTDLTAFKEAMDRGSNMSELMESHFTVMMKYSRFAKEYMFHTRPRQRQWMTYTTVFWGPPGSGKTSRAEREAGPEAFWVKQPGQGQTVFFDGYEGQENVIIDEFYGWIPRHLMCRLLDRYPCPVDTKGGVVSFYPKRIWITSNVHPNEWYPKVGLGALERRLEGENGVIEYVQGNVREPLPLAAAEDDRPVDVVRAGSKRVYVSSVRDAHVIDVEKEEEYKRRRDEAARVDLDATQPYDDGQEHGSCDGADETAPRYARSFMKRY